MIKSIAREIAEAIEDGQTWTLPCGQPLVDWMNRYGVFSQDEDVACWTFDDGSRILEALHAGFWDQGLNDAEVALGVEIDSDHDQDPYHVFRGEGVWKGTWDNFDPDVEIMLDLNDSEKERRESAIAWTSPIVAYRAHDDRATGFDYLCDAIDDWCDSISGGDSVDRALSDLYRKLLHAGHVCSLHGDVVECTGEALEIGFGDHSVQIFAKPDTLVFLPRASIAETLRDCEEDLITALPAIMEDNSIEVKRENGKITFIFSEDDSELTFDCDVYED